MASEWEKSQQWNEDSKWEKFQKWRVSTTHRLIERKPIGWCLHCHHGVNPISGIYKCLASEWGNPSSRMRTPGGGNPSIVEF